MSAFRLTVPGNLLLAGEYAVLEEGGLGAALAVEPRMVVTVFPSRQWEIAGRWVGGEERWDPESTAAPTFAGSVFLKALELLENREDERGRRWPHRIPPARIEIDSSGFFDVRGRKQGFGSSAALAAGLTAALARLGEREATASVHQIAVAAHRHAQGGAGSGYDVTVSWFGGFGLFTGGAIPRWEPSEMALLPPLALFPGPQAVRTVRSIARYREWKAAAGRTAREFLDASNAAVDALLRARNRAAFLEAWSRTAGLGVELGNQIGSDATVAVPEGLAPRTFVKALGAGNETGLAAAPEDGFPSPLPEGLVPLIVSREGLRWE
jgi:phosphomevalonate kinase